MNDKKPSPDRKTDERSAPDGEKLAREIEELREKNADAEPGTGHPGDPQVGGAGPGATGHKS